MLPASIRKNGQLYLMLLLPIAYIVIFKYVPMYGIQIAFKQYISVLGFWDSPWVGFHHFEKFVHHYKFTELLMNTLVLSVYNLSVNFVVPIALALMLSNSPWLKFKKTTQMVSYAPHFISTVVMAGIVIQFLAPRGGLINRIIGLFGIEPVSFMTNPQYFKTIYVVSDIWQHAGWGSILFIAALSAIDPGLHEAAVVDGANKWQRMRYIDIPGIMPTTVIVLILSLGQVMNIGFEKAFLLQNDLNLQSSEIIPTYVYKVGMMGYGGAAPDFSFATAVGLFNSVINFILLVAVNQWARTFSDTKLW